LHIDSLGEIPDPLFADPGFMYIVFGNGTSGRHVVRTPYPGVSFNTYRTLSLYMKMSTCRFAQISLEGDAMFAIFDLELSVVGTMHQFVDATITPAANGWFRCSMTITSIKGQGFVIGLVTAANAVKGQTNTLATSMFLAFPQMEAGQVATSYIPTGTRAADIITIDVAMSLFRLYGERDFVGPMGRRGLIGADSPPGESIIGPQEPHGESIVGPQGPPGESIVGP
jgi:hypothetical protein